MSRLLLPQDPTAFGPTPSLNVTLILERDHGDMARLGFCMVAPPANAVDGALSDELRDFDRDTLEVILGDRNELRVEMTFHPVEGTQIFGGIKAFGKGARRAAVERLRDRVAIYMLGVWPMLDEAWRLQVPIPALQQIARRTIEGMLERTVRDGIPSPVDVVQPGNIKLKTYNLDEYVRAFYGNFGLGAASNHPTFLEVLNSAIDSIAAQLPPQAQVQIEAQGGKGLAVQIVLGCFRQKNPFSQWLLVLAADRMRGALTEAHMEVIREALEPGGFFNQEMWRLTRTRDEFAQRYAGSEAQAPTAAADATADGGSADSDPGSASSSDGGSAVSSNNDGNANTGSLADSAVGSGASEASASDGESTVSVAAVSESASEGENTDGDEEYDDTAEVASAASHTDADEDGNGQATSIGGPTGEFGV